MDADNSIRTLCPASGPTIALRPVRLSFEPGLRTNVFAGKNNKTLRETLAHRRYMKFSPEITARYAAHLDDALGVFLLEMKERGDPIYRKFLNPNGDKAYCTFRIADPTALMKTGIYAYYRDDKLCYIGRCRDSMKKRVDLGYGKIHPKNCYIDGQSTNCHLNARIAAAKEGVSLWLYELTEADEIEHLERLLLREFDPPWNVQKG